MEAYEWFEMIGLGAVLVMLWDTHGTLRDISRHLEQISRSLIGK